MDSTLLGRLALPLSLTVLGFALRVGDVARYSLSPDEGLRYFIARAPLADAAELVLRNAHPPLFAILLRVLAPVDDGVVWLRALSLACGTAAIPVLYAAACRVGGRVSGGVAAALLALSPGAISMSQVARPYALQLLLVAGALLFLLRYRDESRRADLLGYSVCAALSVATHYGSVIPIGAMALVMAVEGRRIGGPVYALRHTALAHAPALAMLALLFAVHVGPRLWDSALRESAVTTWLAPHLSAAPAALWKNALGVFVYLAGARFAGVLALAWAVGSLECARRGRACVAGLAVATLAIAALFSGAGLLPMGAIRHVTALAPILLLPVGAGVAILAGRGPVVLGGTFLAAIAWWLAAGPIEGGLGFPPRDARAFRELTIPAAELSGAADLLASLEVAPGSLVLDRSTAFALAPLLTPDLARATPIGDSGLLGFRRGQRRVVWVDRWLLEVGPGPSDPAAHLATALGADASPDVAILTVHGRAVAAQLATLVPGGDVRRAGVAASRGGDHVRLLSLDRDRYARALAIAERQP